MERQINCNSRKRLIFFQHVDIRECLREINRIRIDNVIVSLLLITNVGLATSWDISNFKDITIISTRLQLTDYIWMNYVCHFRICLS